MDETKYTLAEHLEEFRKRLIYCLVFFGIFSALSWQLVPAIMSALAAPAGKLVFLRPTEAFFTYLKVSFWSGFFFSLPAILYNVWKFVSLGLTEAERRSLVVFAPASFFLFLLGASFAFFLAIPLAVKFLIGFGRGFAEPMLSIGDYISFVSWLLLAFGASFELPLVIFFLAKLKVVTRQSLSAFRRQAVILIFVAAAIITPTPDALTQLLLAGPLLVLYEAGVLLSRWA